MVVTTEAYHGKLGKTLSIRLEISEEMLMNQELSNLFQTHFQHAAQLEVHAAGRVNLIGEHTDYNDGLVLPTAIPQKSTLQISKRANSDQTVQIYSVQMNQKLEYTLGSETSGRGWLDYPQAITHALRLEGYAIEGFDALVSSDVPLGSGLSSSAAFLVVLLRGIRGLFDLQITDLEIAKLAQRAENGPIVGARVGLMDQMACSLANQGEALFIDFKTGEFERVPLPKTAELVIIHSGITHSNAHDDGSRNYKTRRAECEKACELLGIKTLRDLEIGDLGRINALPSPYSNRARHVVTENARVIEAVAAFKAGDLTKVGQLFGESHASMRDDYDMSETEIDVLVEIARAHPSIYGARLTGGGFGGSIVALAKVGQGRAAGEQIALEYQNRTGITPKLLTPAQ
jgi:galactokinase